MEWSAKHTSSRRVRACNQSSVVTRVLLKTRGSMVPRDFALPGLKPQVLLFPGAKFPLASNPNETPSTQMVIGCNNEGVHNQNSLTSRMLAGRAWTNSALTGSILLSLHLSLSPLILWASPHSLRPKGAMKIPTAPDEETPLLGCREVQVAAGVVFKPNSEVVTLESSSQNSQTPSIKCKAPASGVLELIKKTPLSWVQFSILLFLQLSEPLTSNVIYPMSLTLDSCFGISDWTLNGPIYLVCT